MAKSYGSVDYRSDRVAAVIVRGTPRQYAAWAITQEARETIMVPTKSIEALFATDGQLIGRNFLYTIPEHEVLRWACEVIAETLRRGVDSAAEYNTLRAIQDYTY